MATAVTERPLTGADVAALPTDLPSGAVRYELWEGVLQIMPPTGDFHGSVESRLAGILLLEGEWNGHGQVRSGEVGVYLQRDPDTLVGVDVAFLTPDQLPPVRSSEGFLETVPALMVEVVSRNEGPADVRRKVEAYLTAGARAVWVVDPEARRLTVHRPGAVPRTWTEGEAFTDDFPVPGLRIPLRRLFG